MAIEKPDSKRKGGGGKLARSETVTVRMDSKLNYLADLAARKHRRTLSSFVEWAIQQSFKEIVMDEGNSYSNEPSTSLSDMESRLWDVDQSERFARLAILYPDLLTHEEQERWKLLTDSQLLSPAMGRRNGYREWNWPTLEDQVFPILRRHWNSLLVAHEGGTETSKKWVSEMQEKIAAGAIYKIVEAVKTKAAPQSTGAGFDDLEDDIPF